MSWSTWCRENTFQLQNLAHRAEFLVDTARVLLIQDAPGLLDFSARYPGEDQIGLCRDWVRLARDYAGLVITPYLWECRLDPRTLWYYGWDCASGVIWDMSCLTLLTRTY